jgi:hypothetical protein
VQGFAVMINLKTDADEWSSHVQVTHAADGVWDEPSAFPGIMNAYFQATDRARDRMQAPFAE